METMRKCKVCGVDVGPEEGYIVHTETPTWEGYPPIKYRTCNERHAQELASYWLAVPCVIAAAAPTEPVEPV